MMNQTQKKNYARFKLAAKKLGAVRMRPIAHGIDKFTAEGYDEAGTVVCDWNL